MHAQVFAPGKLFVMGEYAVLFGGRALVAAMAAGIRCTVERRPAGWWLTAPDLDLDLELEAAFAAPPGRLLADAAFTGAREAGISTPLRVLVEGSHPSSRAKRGLGGSAAAVVAILGAMAAAAGNDVESPELRRRLFSLALDVHRRNQSGRGSGADIAASVNGGWTEFAWIDGVPHISAASVPPDIGLSAVWSGVAVDTNAALDRFDFLRSADPLGLGARPSNLDRGPQSSAKHEARGTTRNSLALFRGVPRDSGAGDRQRADGSDYSDGLLESKLLVQLARILDRFWSAARAGDRDRLLDAVSTYGDQLEELNRDADSRAAELVRTARHAGAAAKGSGAVGGDCVIALAFQPSTLARVEEDWRRLGAEVLSLGIDLRGVRREVAHA